MKASIKSSSIFLTIFFVFFNQCIAGLPAGPYIVWVNLHEDTKPQITKSIRDFLKTQQDQNICHGYLPGWIVYTKRRPEGITNNLTSKAFNEQDMSSRQSLIKAMKSFRDETDVKEGLDGIVAYTEEKAPHIISMDTHGNIKKSKFLASTDDSQALIKSFCTVLPEVYRR